MARSGFKLESLWLIGLGMVGVVVVILLWSEGGFADPATAWEVFTNILITLVGEYPDKPKTILGQIFQLLLLLFGTFIFGAIVGKFSSFFVTQALLQEENMQVFNDHIIVCNWNEKAPTVIHQLLQGNQQHPRHIVVISASEIPQKAEFASQMHVHFVQADPTHHATLQKFSASQAKAVILLADEETQGPDEKNALIALAIKHLEQDSNICKNIHVVAELVNFERYRHLKEAGVDEMVSVRDYSSGIIAQSALFKNMSVVYQQLLTYTDDTNEFYFMEPGNYPVSWQGLSFAELTQNVARFGQPEQPLILVGIRRGNGDILLNPKRSQFQRLAPDDTLIIMAFQVVERLG
ncbi:Ion transport 2 domain protein [Gloeomargarita lithophora Alchichica-D10]|uniref:Ion transport 2 domain protein n=1 Tax=Gloeomargarita lithophora Alchichica-D10 TaxID=1188229 RepID=A0A1J0AGZ1_9CYAN|nr:NAD(P)-binding protein [Gloeomargarita lithophora]APB35206.1 Ion transport 2 domain protein [Gloeomargarita lithophora Alchichica-D10]